MNVVQQLVAGSHNIDRMRAEIHQVVPIIFSVLRYPPLTAGVIELNDTIVSGKCTWIVTGRVNPFLLASALSTVPLAIQCFLTATASTSGIQIYWSRDYEREVVILAERVQDVYESLPEMVEEIFIRFPWARERCQPLIRAVEKF